MSDLDDIVAYARNEFGAVMGHKPDPNDDRPFLVLVKALEAIQSGNHSELRRLASIARSYRPAHEALYKAFVEEPEGPPLMIEEIDPETKTISLTTLPDKPPGAL